MPQSVHFGQACPLRMAHVDSKLLDVVAIAWNQRAFASQLVGAVKYLPLIFRSDRKRPCLATLGPGRF
jgi:hypothetical protein